MYSIAIRNSNNYNTISLSIMISRKSVHISVTQSSMRTKVYKQYSTNIYTKENVKIQVGSLSVRLVTGLLFQYNHSHMMHHMMWCHRSET